MSCLHLPDLKHTITNYVEIQSYLQGKGIHYERWELPVAVAEDADEKTVLSAYGDFLAPYMEKQGYQTADVVCVHAGTPQVGEVRKKFLSEHTHSEDEVRFFVKGRGLFWFHLPETPIFSVLCQEGDLLSVPAGVQHWFDIGETPYVKAIRMFLDPQGWIAQYTHSKVEARYAEFSL